MAGRFAMLRGSRIACFGSADLVRLDATGRKRWLMQADQVLYLHPDRERLQGPAIDVSSPILDDWKRLAGLPIDRLMAAALACVDEADFRRRIRERLNRTETRR